jgi:hypothetical protein
MARRSGDKWYVVGANAQKETLKVKVELPMFEGGDKVKLYSDDEQLNGSVSELKIKKNREVEITIPCNGGVLIEK